MNVTARTASAALAGLLLTGVLAGCTSETELTEADQSQIPTEELVGQSMTLTNEVQEVLDDGIITIGEEDTVVMAQQLPEDLRPGDDVAVTGTVEERDVFTTDDFEALQQVTDQETAQYLVDRGEELVLTGATVTRTD